MNEQAVSILAYWINERERIKQKKESGAQQPWTDDAILATYRFCNVHRDDDAVTKFIKQEWLPRIAPENRVRAAIAGRLFNRPEVLALLTKALFTKTWQENTLRILKKHRDAGHRTFNAAYIITTCGVPMDKLDYCVFNVLGAAQGMRPPVKGDSLGKYARLLTTVPGLNTFLAAQVVGDLRDFSPLATAPDQQVFALSGPGSRRGLNRILDRPVDARWKEEQWWGNLIQLQEHLLNAERHPPLIGAHVGNLHAQDLQNCLCEFDKYMRTIKGEGTPKQKYTPAA